MQTRPPLSRRTLLMGLLLLAALGFALPATAADERYPANLAWRLITEKEIQELTGCPQPLGREESEAPPFFEPPQTPLGGIETMGNRGSVVIRPDSQWDVAPFPTLEPPPPKDQEGRAAWEARQTASTGPRPDVFSDIGTEHREAPSAQLRPRNTTISDALVTPDDHLPVPFSLRRYHTKDRGFFQVAVYGGESGIAAERHYRTLHAAAPNREPVSGVGEEAFMALVPRPRPPEEPKAAPEEAGPAFGAIDPVGPKRLDLVDEGLAKAKSAPAFQSIPVDLGVPEGLRKERHDEEPGEDPLDKQDLDPFGGSANASGGGVQVLVAFFPSKGLVLELAMDDRVGDSQSLIRMAFMVQSRMLQRW